MGYAEEKIVHEIISASIQSRGKSIRQRRSGNLNHPAAAWTAENIIGNMTGTALSLVLNTIGCTHARSDAAGCTMCSYLLDGTSTPPTNEQLLNQFIMGMKKLDGLSEPLAVKLYTSGSFLDESEVPVSVRSDILTKIQEDDRLKQVVLESRPEYVTPSTMAHIRDCIPQKDVEIGIGLESVNDAIRSICINKGFSLSDFQQALTIARNHDIDVRAYVLVKPPFLTERDALEDSVETITKAIEMGVTTVSVNPVNIQKNTLVDRLWFRGVYRPPWLWTVVEVLNRAREQTDAKTPIICDPVAAGKQRGTHNCGKCDKQIVKAIRTFSLKQDVAILKKLHCDCKKQWQHTLLHEDSSLVIHNDRDLV